MIHHHHSSKTFLKPKKTSYPSPSLDLSMFAVKSSTCKHTHGLVLILKHFVLTWPPSFICNIKRSSSPTDSSWSSLFSLYSHCHCS
jgi:hypothetical protein